MLGGDGTYNEVLNGLEDDVPLGFLPGGGTSVLPRALGLPRNPVAAAKRIAEGRTRRIGLGRVNGRRFGFSAGLGLDAELVRRVDELGRSPDGRRPGDVAFMKVDRGRAQRTPRPVRRAARDRRRRARGVRSRRELHPVHVLGLGRRLTWCRARASTKGSRTSLQSALRARDLPRLLVHGVRGSGLKDGHALAAHDVDRIVVRCDIPLPLQVDGEDAGDVLKPFTRPSATR